MQLVRGRGRRISKEHEFAVCGPTRAGRSRTSVLRAGDAREDDSVRCAHSRGSRGSSRSPADARDELAALPPTDRLAAGESKSRGEGIFLTFARTTLRRVGDERPAVRKRAAAHRSTEYRGHSRGAMGDRTRTARSRLDSCSPTRSPTPSSTSSHSTAATPLPPFASASTSADDMRGCSSTPPRPTPPEASADSSPRPRTGRLEYALRSAIARTAWCSSDPAVHRSRRPGRRRPQPRRLPRMHAPPRDELRGDEPPPRPRDSSSVLPGQPPNSATSRRFSVGAQMARMFPATIVDDHGPTRRALRIFKQAPRRDSRQLERASTARPRQPPDQALGRDRLRPRRRRTASTASRSKAGGSRASTANGCSPTARTRRHGSTKARSSRSGRLRRPSTSEIAARGDREARQGCIRCRHTRCRVRHRGARRRTASRL